jgi:hypothetical protein
MFVFFVSRNSGPIKICSSFEALSAYKISWSRIESCKFCIHLSSLKTPPSPYSEGPLNKIIIQMKLISMFMIYRYTKRLYSKCHGWWFVSIKENYNFKFQPPAMFVFLVSSKRSLIKSCPFSDDNQDTKFHCPTLNGASSASTSGVWTSAVLEWLQIRH